jgi:hypothetical protein
MILIWMERSLKDLQLSFRTLKQKTSRRASFWAIFVASSGEADSVLDWILKLRPPKDHPRLD